MGDPNGSRYALGARQPGNDGGPLGPERGQAAVEASPVNGFWAGAEWILCTDGKARAVEPGTFPLAAGVPARVGRLRGYGNSIVPEAAAEFIRASEEGVGG